ncbi:hypothetical protein NPIL_640491 [Nephila pilipes]|uniref:Uncharacterized protein n=1 Tax=Nephila pilipes TaxID=299642 RepID=A0A8X6TQE3_NEPPI|nr:hypothetical protein NPIL_640491 [Nephila pilipes]
MSRYLRQRDNLLKDKRGAGALDRTLPLSSPEPATPHRGQPVPSPVKRPARHQCALGVSLDAPDLSCRSQARIKRESWRESDSEHRDSTDPTRWERESLQAPDPVTRKTEKMSRRVDGPAPVSEPLEEQTKGDFDFLHIP